MIQQSAALPLVPGKTTNEPKELLEEKLLLEQLAGLREVIYWFLGQSLRYPDDRRFAEVAEAAQTLWDERSDFSRFTYYPQLLRAVCAIKDVAAAHLIDTQTNHVALFSAHTGAVPCPPYESAFLAPPGESSGLILSQIERDYRASGFHVPAGTAEQSDHIAVELEYISLLCGVEARAWEEKDVAGALRAIANQTQFIEKHLRVWLPGFAAAVGQAEEGSIYRDITTASAVLVVHDVELLRRLTTRLARLDTPESSPRGAARD